MTNTKHTREPWTLGQNAYSAQDHAICAPAGHPMDARVIAVVQGPVSERSQADVHLIAAAPELLAFAQAYRLDLQERGIRESDMDESAMDLLNMADAAIAKATGEAKGGA